MLTVWIFLQLLAFASCVSVEDFFPFGEAVGDSKLPNRKHAFGEVLTLNGTYSFYNKSYNELQVHGDGLITLGKDTFLLAAMRHRQFPFPPNTPSVAVFYAPVELKNLSEVFYRETRDEGVLKKATDHVRWSFVGDKDFEATNVFIATWNNVIHADNRFHNKSNTFQVVLITDGQNTYSLFNYKDDGLQWIKGYHVRYQGSRFLDAQVGFSAGDQVRSYMLPGSGNKDVKLLSTKSNVLYSGQWMFKIGRPKMGASNVQAADSYYQKDSDRPPYFIVDQYFNGCFKVHAYLSSNASEIWHDVSIRSCMILCHERNFRYAALHNGSQCACLNEPEYSRLEKLPKEACDVRCVENDEEVCGGKTTASVFWAVASSILSADERDAGLNDVDECDSGVSRCHSAASCKNKAPGYCCECNEGYYGNGVVCEPEGGNVRFNGKLSGNINGITFSGLLMDMIAITKDGRVYVIIRNPPAGLKHSLKILTPFGDVVGWMHAVKNVKDVPNGFSIIGDRFTRSAVVSFDTGEELSLNQKFIGKDASGRYISMETIITGTMPDISPDSSVRVNSFKEVYRREDHGRVESDGAVTFEVDGKANGFSVQQNIAYDELSGCKNSFYKFDVQSRVLLSKYDEKQDYSGVAIKSAIVNASKPDTQGLQGNGNPCGPQKQTCHAKASCVNGQGKEQCRCKDGYQGDGTKCEDVDECLFDVARCSSDANCINTAGSYSCKCRSGFTGDGFSCIKDSQCSQKCDADANCTEYLGSWRCVCNPGYKGDGLTCEPDGTCAGVQCSEHAQCLYAADNSRECVCNDGYQGDGQTCAPRDKCEGVTCGANATCDVTGICGCDQGFQGDGQRCEDVDECKESLHKCHSDADCTNTVGSYLCHCKQGYLGDGINCVKEEVSSLCNGQKCHAQAQCLDRKCVCNSGYQGDGVTCTDINECFADNECDTFADCTNTNGSYICTCKVGYKGNGNECTEVDPSGTCGGEKCHMYASCFQDDTGRESCGCQLGFFGHGVECQDLDECRLLATPCEDDKTECVNTLGSFECLCKTGFMEFNQKCVSDDTCMGIDCHPDAVCDPFRGCICRSGYQGDGTSCEDEDECDSSRSPCDLNAGCTNTEGSFQCRCKPGFSGNGFRCQRVEGSCNGVDCDTHAQCVQPVDDKPLQCQCEVGWQGDGQTCSDVDECEEFKNFCHPLRAECINSEGSYECRCKPGYQGDGFNCTSDGTCDGVHCHDNATCFKPSPEQHGVCACKDGWRGDGRTCYEINECESPKNSCDDNANCINTEGSYRCECKLGYQGDGFSCVLDDSCGGVRCDSNADCLLNENRQTCLCKNGWSGDGETCFDVDECQPFKNDCHFDGECINTEGSYGCRCRPGYQGNGFDCASDGTCEGITCDKNADCNRTFPSGRRECKCKAGWQGDGRSCFDVDECQPFKNNCSLSAECVNIEGSYECRCRPGYQGDGFTCTSDGSCEGVFCDSNADCRRIFPEGVRKCKCRDGWQGDGRNCSDIDECQPSKNLCHLDAVCVNTEGSFECRCRRGYQGNGFSCVSDDTCEGIICNENADCNRTFPSGRRQCLCKAGWQGNGRSCSDVNECEPSNVCHSDAVCVNTYGSFECRCRRGYQGNGFSCVSDGTCEGIICDQNADCNRTSPSGRRRCICKAGWQGDGRSCSDINECQSSENNCHQKAKCINIEGSFECSCKPGYLGNGVKCTSDGSCDGVFCGTNASCKETSGDQRQCSCNEGWRGNGTHCSDVDECESSSSKCDLNADCFNSPGSYQCRCRLGYLGDGSNCVSDGTCDGVICGQNSACVPRAVGSRDRQCVCVDGWKGDGRSCTDINECQAVNKSCHRHAGCVNTPGSFFCQCKLGYEGNGFECKSDGTCAGVVCHVNATCRNLIQGPTCACKGGYQGSGTICTDNDECQTGQDNECNSNADCLNTIGSYSCQCKPGYQGSGFVCKSDGTCAGVRCHPDATCDQEALLGPVCVCKPGYKGDGRKCSDIDECTTNDHKCHQEAECINTVGAHNCSCKPGFEGDGYNCKPDGTCAGIVCALDAECVTSPSNARFCKCKAGFAGNGLNCRDIDECALLIHKCHRKSKCVNKPGSYVCRCKPGYYGNGFNCSSDGTCEGVVCDYNADCVTLNNGVDQDKECQCRKGFTGDGEICSDINECEDPSVCPDKSDCYNMAGSFMCHCLPGYKKLGKTCKKDCNLCLNGGSCTENNTCLCPPGFSGKRCQWHGEASLIYSKGSSIQRMSLPPRPNDIGIIYQRPGAVHVGVDYDCVDQTVYWTEVTKGVIARAKYDGSDMEVIVNSGKATSPEGIAVDWLGRNIYWTDSQLDTIQVAKLDGTQRRTLVSSDLRNPRAIIVDPPNGKMYWADWSRNQPKIEVANLDGSDRRVLVQSPTLKLPNGLTLVHSTNELCYCDAGVREISCVNLGDLSMRKAYRQAHYPFGITNFNRTLFWTDWRLGRIQRMGIHSKTRDTPLRSFVGSSGKIFDIKAVQPCGRIAATYDNPCAVANGGCPGLCLLKSKSYSCSCPDGLHPVKTGNGTKCEEKCDNALGMASGAITDEQLSAHSAWSNNHQRYGASRARLYLNEWPQGWNAQKNDPSPWLQIDFLQTRTVTAVETQGYGNEKEREWVKTYVLLTSRDGERWNAYKEGGRKRVFIGNVDTSSVVRNELKMPQTTRWLRIVPRSWNNHIGMRVELYGC